MAEISIADVLALTADKRLELAELLWNSLEENPEVLPLSEEQKTELDKRLQYYYEHKEESLSWAVVKEQIRSLR